MKVIENFLPIKEFNTIKNIMTGRNFAWFLHKGVNHDNDNYYQFCHNFYSHYRPSTTEDNLSIINPIIEKLKIVSLLRIKANLIYKTNKIIEHGYHVDFENLNNKTSIFYVNSNNGYTLFKNNKKIKSNENTLVEFDSKLEHTGTTCTDEEYRIVINFNYFKIKDERHI